MGGAMLNDSVLMARAWLSLTILLIVTGIVLVIASGYGWELLLAVVAVVVGGIIYLIWSD